MSQNNLLNISGMDYNMAGGGYRCVLVSGGCIEIEGIRSVAHFSDDSAEFNLKRGKLKVDGDGLKLTCLSRGYARLSGRIDAISITRA